MYKNRASYTVKKRKIYKFKRKPFPKCLSSYKRNPSSYLTVQCVYTDKKENKIFLIYKEIQSRIVEKIIYEDGLSNIWGNAQTFHHIWGGR